MKHPHLDHQVESYPTEALVSRLNPVVVVEPWHLELADRMFEIIDHGERRGVGLAANQVGAMVRMFVWRVGDRSGIVLNPEVLYSSDSTAVAMEGCLSLPERFVVGVQRAKWITVRWMKPDGQYTSSVIWDEYTARVWQHEIDHLNGLSIVDMMTSSWKRKKRTQLASIMTARRLLVEEDRGLGHRPAPMSLKDGGGA